MKLPKTLYVKIESDKDATYFVCEEDASGLVEMGQKIKIGVYELVETKNAEGIANFSKSTKEGK